jgi:hypothetical protein
MAGVSESSLWKWLKEQDPLEPRLHQERVENSAGSATPDVEGQIGGAHFSLELKIFRDPTIRNREEQGRIKFEIGQREWGQKRWHVGGTSYCLVQAFHEDLYLIPGAFLMALPLRGVVKTSYLQDLSWWFTEKKNPQERYGLYSALGKPNAAHQWVAQRLLTDQQLREAATPADVHPVLSSLGPA